MFLFKTAFVFKGYLYVMPSVQYDGQGGNAVMRRMVGLIGFLAPSGSRSRGYINLMLLISGTT